MNTMRTKLYRLYRFYRAVLKIKRAKWALDRWARKRNAITRVKH